MDFIIISRTFWLISLGDSTTWTATDEDNAGLIGGRSRKYRNMTLFATGFSGGSGESKVLKRKNRYELVQIHFQQGIFEKKMVKLAVSSDERSHKFN